jgi:hypothetical protein
MPRTLSLLVCLGAAGCAADPPPPFAVDECEPRPFRAGGRTEVGLGTEFAPITDGQDVVLVEGYRHLWTLTVNAQVSDMDVGSDDSGGIVNFTAYEGDQQVSLDVGCRVRDFETAGHNMWQLASDYILSMHPDYEAILDGAVLTLRVDVLDRHGRRAASERTVVTHLPPPE